MEILNKGGISHIEVMLSFLIFIGFVIFALYFFSPIQTSRLVESSLSYAFREVKINVSVELESYSVSLNLTSVIVDTIAVNLSNSLVNANVRAENYLETVVPSMRDSNNPNIIYFEWADTNYGSGKGFVIIKLSEDFEPYSGTVNSTAVDEDLYGIASSNTVKLISEKRILALKDLYIGDYVSLKERFNLPGRVGFGFGLVFDENDKIEAQEEVPKGVEVFSDSERVEVLRTNGNIEFADLIVEIW